MQAPAMFRGEQRSGLIKGLIGGAVATMAIGFIWGGWTTGGTAKAMAAKAAEQATTAALVPSCKSQFASNSDAMGKFKAETSSYARERLVRDSVKEINGVSLSSNLVDACAAAVSKDLVKAAAKT